MSLWASMKSGFAEGLGFAPSTDSRREDPADSSMKDLDERVGNTARDSMTDCFNNMTVTSPWDAADGPAYEGGTDYDGGDDYATYSPPRPSTPEKNEPQAPPPNPKEPAKDEPAAAEDNGAYLACSHNGQPTSSTDLVEHLLNGEIGSALRDVAEAVEEVVKDPDFQEAAGGAFDTLNEGLAVDNDDLTV